MIAFALIAASALANTPPEITNVRAQQKDGTKLVDIYYDAADAEGDLLKIRVEISDNDGVKYSVPALTFTGDIGEGVAPGKGKHIVWDAGKDWDGEYSDQMRVKIFAIDAQGFPGLEWGNEVPPGGFLMGQDGGAEGSGPSKHINIPWSYWLSKYEITVAQYCDFLNAAYAAGNIYLDGTTMVRSNGSSVFEGYCNAGVPLCKIGDAYGIRWNVNNFEVVGDRGNTPSLVTYYGATAFARFYGYDLPTDAEWEKAARGPDNDDQDEHLCYPWGNFCSAAYANTTTRFEPSYMKVVGFYNGNQTPVGPDTVNGYGLYDVIGNAAEWTRTSYSSTVDTYETVESLDYAINLPYRYGYSYYDQRVYRGAADAMIYSRYYYGLSGSSVDGYNKGFRVARRHGVEDVKTTVSKVIDFNWSSFTYNYTTDGYATACQGHNGTFAMVPGYEGNGVVCTEEGSYFGFLYFYLSRQRVCYFTLKAKNTTDVERKISMQNGTYETESSSSSFNLYPDAITLPPNMTEFKTISFDGAPALHYLQLNVQPGVIIDDIEFHTIAK